MTTVRDDELKRYLEVFHETYRNTAGSLIPADLRLQLLRIGLLETGIHGYISTQFGAGYEYVPGTAPGVVVSRGSSRIEDLLLGTPRAVRRLRATGIAFAGGFLTLEHVAFKDMYPFRLEGEATARLVNVDVSAGPWRRHVSYAEITTNRSTDYWSEAMAVVRAKDELLVAVIDAHELQRRRSEEELDLGTFLSKFKQRHVLLCGDFREGRERLDVIRAALNSEGYDPVLLDEVPDEPHQDLRQKFRAVAPAVRFVVIDDSSRGGQMVEVELADQGHFVTLVLHERRSTASRSFMTAAASATSAVLSEEDYGERDVADVVHRGCEWAEATLSRLRITYEGIFPWRSPSGGA